MSRGGTAGAMSPPPPQTPTRQQQQQQRQQQVLVSSRGRSAGRGEALVSSQHAAPHAGWDQLSAVTDRNAAAAADAHDTVLQVQQRFKRLSYPIVATGLDRLDDAETAPRPTWNANATMGSAHATIISMDGGTLEQHPSTAPPAPGFAGSTPFSNTHHQHFNHHLQQQQFLVDE